MKLLRKAVLACALCVIAVAALSACSGKNAADRCVHVFGAWQEGVAATCSGDGIKGHKDCKKCGKHFDRNEKELSDLEIKASGHKFGEWKTVKKPSVGEDGKKERVCSVCAAVETETIPKLSQEKSFTITYETDGGEIFGEANPVAYKNTDDDVTIKNPYKAGYVFEGWSDGVVSAVKNYVIRGGSEGDIKLMASYKRDTTAFYNGGTANVLPEEVRGYLEADNKAEYLYEYHSEYKVASDPFGVKLEWENVYGADKFTVTFANESGEETFSINANKPETKFYNPVPQIVYSYTVRDEDGNVLKKDAFKVTEPLRTIYCGNVNNVRDEGGKTTPYGTIGYGLIYRSPEIFTANDEARKILSEELGIKTEIDLRFESTTPTIDENITKYKLGILQWDYLFPDMTDSRPWQKQYTDNLKSIFKLFADKRNYPIVFHCSAGADRTGTIGFLLNGFLGVSYEDLAADFEITSFYQGRRWRADITESNGTHAFFGDGAMQDNPDNLVSFDRTYNYILKKYGTESGELKDAIENYLKTVVGLTDYDLRSIRHIMFSTQDHEYGEWEIIDKGSCQRTGEKRRYCACGIYETEIIPVSGHVFGEWQTIKEATEEAEGLEKRFCECGAEESRIIPRYVKRTYDFGGKNFDATVNTPAVNRLAATADQNPSLLPTGYGGVVFSRKSDNFVSVGIGFADDYDIDKLESVKIRLCIQGDGTMPKGNVRIYDDDTNAIRADEKYGSLSGVYNEWVEIDLLPLIKTAREYIEKDGKLQKFVLVIRTGAEFTVAFDSVTVLSR